MREKYYAYRNILMFNSINSDSEEDYKKIKKYIGIDTEDMSDTPIRKKTQMGGTNYDKLLNLCSKVGINIYVNEHSKKTKSYEQLLQSCNKKKRDVIKKCVL